MVGEGGISPSYFLDEMTFTEINLFLKGFSNRPRENWEQTRMLAYIIAQCNSTKKLKATDILSFPWDEQKKQMDTDPEQLDRLREKAKLIEKNLKR